MRLFSAFGGITGRDLGSRALYLHGVFSLEPAFSILFPPFILSKVLLALCFDDMAPACFPEYLRGVEGRDILAQRFCEACAATKMKTWWFGVLGKAVIKAERRKGVVYNMFLVRFFVGGAWQ